MPHCDPDGTIPRTCADAFGAVSRQLGELRFTLDAVHAQTAKTNGHVEELFRRTNRHETRIELLRAGVAESRLDRATWGRRVWQAVVGLALLLAGYLLKTG